MRKNCPYCGVELMASDEHFRSSWVFLRCHHCNGSTVVHSTHSLGPFNQRFTRPEIKAEPRPFVAPALPPLPKIAVNEEFEEPTLVIEDAPLDTRARGLLLSATVFAVAFAFLVVNRFSPQKSVDIVMPLTAPNPAPIAAVVPADAEAQPATEAAATSSKSRMTVQVKTNAAVFRSGPGTQFRRVGVAQAELRLFVKNQQDDWYEVEMSDPMEGPSSAWIRSDLVKVVEAEGEGKKANL